MAFHDIAVYVDNDRQCKNRLQSAVQLAQSCSARLIGVYVRRQLELPSYAEMHVPKDVLAAGEKSLSDMSAAAREAFAQCTEHTSLETDYHQLRGVLPEVLAGRLHHVDLAVVAQRHPDAHDLNAHYRPDPLLFQAGRPLLVVPHAGTFAFPARRVTVAWNASAPSARALHDALPLLRQATDVLVVSVGKGRRASLADGELGPHLARHGIECELREIEGSDHDAHEHLSSAVADAGSELLVMGGYGHARLREIVLGGVTRHVLSEMNVPVLMSH